jgi:hypothetical protein
MTARGCLYIQTNENENRVLHFIRGEDGRLTEVEPCATGGSGSGTFKYRSDTRAIILDGAQGLVLSPDRRFLFAVNVRDNSVSRRPWRVSLKDTDPVTKDHRFAVFLSFAPAATRRRATKFAWSRVREREGHGGTMMTGGHANCRVEALIEVLAPFKLDGSPSGNCPDVLGCDRLIARRPGERSPRRRGGSSCGPTRIPGRRVLRLRWSERLAQRPRACYVSRSPAQRGKTIVFSVGASGHLHLSL